MTIFTNIMFYFVLPNVVLFIACIIIVHFWGDKIINAAYHDENKYSFDEHIKEHWGDLN